MGDMLFLNEGPFSNNMIDLNILRKTTAKSIVQNAKMLDCYEVINKGNGSLYFCGALSLLRECSLSREAIKIVESSPKTYSKTMGKGFLEMSMHREKSKLIVMHDAKDTPDAPQERQIG